MLPLNKIGYDEEAHFRNTLLFPIPSQIESTEAINKLTSVTHDNWPLNITQSYNENKLMQEYYYDNCDYTDNKLIVETETRISSYSMPSYLFMAIGVRLGMLLGLPFLYVFIIGRLMNLFVYALVVYFAIKKMPMGKHISTIICLMPTTIFQACVYTYDNVLLGFFFLGFAYLLKEILEKDKIISVKNGFLALFFITFSCFAKPVYFPLLFMGFLLSKNKFKNKKEKNIFRAANIFCIIGLIFCIILPMLITSSIIEDNRYGNVDAIAQMSLIFNNPVSFVIVLFNNYIIPYC